MDANVNSGHDTMQRNQASLQAIFMRALSSNWAVRGVAMVTYNDNLKNTMNLNGNSDWGYANLATGGLIGWARTYIEEYHEIRANHALQADLSTRMQRYHHLQVAAARSGIHWCRAIVRRQIPVRPSLQQRPRLLDLPQL